MLPERVFVGVYDRTHHLVAVLDLCPLLRADDVIVHKVKTALEAVTVLGIGLHLVKFLGPFFQVVPVINK